MLVEGIEPWMRVSIIGWIRGALVSKDHDDWVNVERTQKLERVTRLTLGLATGTWTSWKTYDVIVARLTSQDLLRLVDAILAQEYYGQSESTIESVLREANSAWTVGDRLGRRGLVDRVAEGVRDAVGSTIERSGNAGQMLARAWSKIHGFEGDVSGGYADAVKAVEIAAKPLVEPENAESTLGSIIRVMQRQGDWRLPLREHKLAPSADYVIATCRTLWRGHSDRHGSDDYKDVTLQEARSAVMLAAALVEWFESGALIRREAQPPPPE